MRFHYVIRKFGVSKDPLGVVADGLRHRHANNEYESAVECRRACAVGPCSLP